MNSAVAGGTGRSAYRNLVCETRPPSVKVRMDFRGALTGDGRFFGQAPRMMAPLARKGTLPLDGGGCTAETRPRTTAPRS